MNQTRPIAAFRPEQKTDKSIPGARGNEADLEPPIARVLNVIAVASAFVGGCAISFGLIETSGSLIAGGISSLVGAALLAGLSRAIALLARIEKNTRK